MRLRYRHGHDQEDADIDVTSFMNLMIVLVPVLLMSMTFTTLNVLEIQLPGLAGGAAAEVDPQAKLEVELTDKGIKIWFPENTLVQEIPAIETDDGTINYDYGQLSLVMQAIKRKVVEKKDVLVRSQMDIGYQHIIATMNTVKSYKTVVAASVVEIELFPQISLDDAREEPKKKGKK